MMKPMRKSPRPHNRRRSEQQVAHLPLCIIFEILSKLPLESVLTCRRVCKCWHKLTKESTFITKHFEWSKTHEANRYLIQAHYTADESLFLFGINEKITTKVPFNQMKLPLSTYPFTYNLPAYSIVCSCNGLLCLRPKALLDNVIICNPITKDCVTLPSSTTPFMPCKSYQLGFHFDSSSKKYKVIREFQFSDNQPSKFQLITVGETSWKDLLPSNDVVEPGFDGAAFWNEGFHWKLSEINGLYGTINRILRFDLMEEKFSIISFTTYNDASRNFRLISLRDELKIVEHYRSHYWKIYKVTGNTIEGFSVFLQYAYFFFMPPINKSVQYNVISEIDEETYLMQVNTHMGGINESKLEVFYPRTTPTKFERLDVGGLPQLFNIICYKPSLCSPRA